MRHLLLVSLLLLACAPRQQDPLGTPQPGRPRMDQNSAGTYLWLSRNDNEAVLTTLDAPAAVVWPLAVAAYRQLGLRVDAADTTVHQVSTTAQAVNRRLADTRPSRYLECGSGILGNIADTWQLSVDARMAVEPMDGDTLKTVLATRLDASARPSNGSQDGMAVCASTGRLEQALADAVRQALPATP